MLSKNKEFFDKVREYWVKNYPNVTCDITKAAQEYSSIIGKKFVLRKSTDQKFGKNKFISNNSNCPECENGTLYVQDTNREEYESVIKCTQCSYKKYSDLPVAAQIEELKNQKSKINHREFRVPDDVLKKRRSICKSCEFLNIKTQRCMKCGCKIKHRTYYEILACPIKKW